MGSSKRSGGGDAVKKISVVVPTYNESGNIAKVYERVVAVFDKFLPQYEMELLFEDNFSTDGTREEIEELCAFDPRVKAIFNAKNFGFTRSTYYAVLQATGDAVVLMFADMQDPPEIIPEFVKKWENGNLVVVGIKASSKETFFMTQVRRLYYWLVKKISEIEHIEFYNGFGLYDRSFMDILREMKDAYPYFRGIVAELAPRRCEVKYVHNERENGKTHMNFMRLYDVAMAGITSYSKVAMRLATFLGIGLGLISLIIAMVTFVKKLMFWDSYPVGNAALLVGVFFIGAAQLFFIGLIGEYVLSITIRTMNHPLIVEERRINFERSSKNDE